MTTRSHPPFLAFTLLAGVISAATAQHADQITARGIGALRLCEALRRVNGLFPVARDTIIAGEGDSRWPSKVVSLGSSEWMIFESSWIDTTHVWRIATNSPRYQTLHGARVGMSINDLLRHGDALEFSYPEGYVVITLHQDSVSFLVDDHSAAEFWTHFDFKADSVDALRIMSHDARVKELITGGDCRH